MSAMLLNEIPEDANKAEAEEIIRNAAGLAYAGSLATPFVMVFEDKHTY